MRKLVRENAVLEERLQAQSSRLQKVEGERVGAECLARMAARRAD